MYSQMNDWAYCRGCDKICIVWIPWLRPFKQHHYSDAIMSAMASQITNVTIVYSTVCSGADQRKHQSSVSLAFVRGIYRWPMNSPHKGPVARKMFQFDEVSMTFETQDDVVTYVYAFHITCPISDGNQAAIDELRSFDIFFVVILFKLFNKHSNCCWFNI